jgi:hypothetical protein
MSTEHFAADSALDFGKCTTVNACFCVRHMAHWSKREDPWLFVGRPQSAGIRKFATPNDGERSRPHKGNGRKTRTNNLADAALSMGVSALFAAQFASLTASADAASAHLWTGWLRALSQVAQYAPMEKFHFPHQFACTLVRVLMWSISLICHYANQLVRHGRGWIHFENLLKQSQAVAPTHVFWVSKLRFDYRWPL